MRLLVTGATGYVGRLLVRRLLDDGHQVRALVRNPVHAGTLLPQAVEIMQGDVRALETLGPACADIEVAYYLVHSMEGDDFAFEERDRLAAQLFGAAAQAAGVQRIIYLGGLGDDRTRLSPHLRSRQEVGVILAASGVPVTEFRAAVIIGAGSASFEMLRELTERLPIMICPRWVTSPIQPIAIADVLGYLVGCLGNAETVGRVFEIGGPDVMTYQAMMQRFARLRGVRRVILRVPVLTPRLSSYWVDIVTSTPAAIARPLIEGLRSAIVVRDPAVQAVLPLELTRFEEAVGRALAQAASQEHERPLAWLGRVPERLKAVLQDRFWPAILSDSRTLPCQARATRLYAEVVRIGGPNGWYYWNRAWQLRGLFDRLVGGPGLDRSTPQGPEPQPGDRRDFWQVLEVQPGRRLRLRATMRVPGVAELEWAVAPFAPEGSRLYQTARFRPRGVAGRLYWYGLLPVHLVIFRGMARAIVERAAGRDGPKRRRW